MPDELFLIDGNSLAYRAFFALPESIATSTGVPTNAIFGFASMLVKILTDYGPKATVVVWDAGDTGRKELYADYKAQRTTRPDLLKEQWPHLEPLVDAFGYRTCRVEGYEADDVIASIVERARHADPPIPVMVVTGDRDAYQLVDDGVVKIMTTSRGITDTRVYDREGVIDRYGIPPELIPDFIGLKGDTSDNIPGVPGIGDKTAAELLQRFGSLEERARPHRRDQRRQAQAEPDRARRRRARLQAARDRQARHPDVELDLDRRSSRPRPTARSCATRSASSSCASRCGGSRRRSARPTPPRRRPQAEQALTATRPKRRPSTTSRGSRTSQVAIAVRAPQIPEDALFAADAGYRFGVVRRRLRARSSPATRRAPRGRSWRRSAPGPSSRTTPSRSAEVPAEPRPRHRGRRLPARAGPPRLPVPRAQRGARLRRRRRRRGRRRRAARRARSPTGSARRSAGAGSPTCSNDVELPLVRVLREMEQAGVEARHRAAGRDLDARQGRGRRARARDLRACAARSSRSARRKQLEEVLFGKLGLSRKRRGKTGYSTDARVLQAIRDEHPVIPKIERWRELTKLAQTYLDALPAADRRRTAGSTRRSTRPPRPPGGCRRTTRTSRTSRSGPSSGARSAPASSPSPATCSSRPTTRRSSCGCWRISPARTRSRRSSEKARTSTPRRPVACST